jgi:polyhydroxybutyrate depolymerase
MRRFVSILVALPIVLLAVACGDDGTSGTDVSAATAAPATSVAPPTSAAPTPARDRTVTMTHDGVERTAIVHAPGLDDAAPLVLVLHGKSGTGEDAQNRYGWDPLADAEGFVVAYPQGINRQWNLAVRAGTDDVGFLLALLDDLEATYPIDPERVYVAGMSNGAFMAYRLACEAPDRIAAIGPVAGSLAGECPDATPVSVLHVHGLADELVPFAGGPGIQGLNIPPVEPVLELWADIDGCDPDPAVTRDSAVETSTWEGCVAGTAVELVTIDGAGHQWPGAIVSPRPDADPPASELDATAVLWEFFAAHPHV